MCVTFIYLVSSSTHEVRRATKDSKSNRVQARTVPPARPHIEGRGGKIVPEEAAEEEIVVDPEESMPLPQGYSLLLVFIFVIVVVVAGIVTF